MSGKPYTDLMRSSEIHLLRCLHGMLESDPIETREEFADLMNAAFGQDKLEARRLADDLGYSLSAVYRWIDGRTAPHPSLWPRIVAWTLAALSARIAAYEEAQAMAEPA